MSFLSLAFYEEFRKTAFCSKTIPLDAQDTSSADGSILRTVPTTCDIGVRYMTQYSCDERVQRAWWNRSSWGIERKLVTLMGQELIAECRKLRPVVLYPKLKFKAGAVARYIKTEAESRHCS
eukprot:scaffold8050_cov116-Cylindrotheca_fusiformis.AAC.5